jgi:ribosomal protein L21E
MSDKIDLSGVFDGTKPTVENNLERLVAQIRVEEPIEVGDAPRRILFNVNGGETLRYVHMGSLPQEVVDVINRLPNSIELFCKRELLKSVEKLRKSIERLPDLPHSFDVGDKVRIVQDQLGIMMNPNLLGKTGVVREVDSMSSSYKYTVDLGDRTIKLLEDMMVRVNE